MPEFREPARHGEADAAGTDATRATAHLPGLHIEIRHQRATEGDAERISINLTAMPSFEAFGRAFELANPFAFWMRGAQPAWLPWIEATRAMALPWTRAPSLSGPEPDAGPGNKDGSPG